MLNYLCYNLLAFISFFETWRTSTCKRASSTTSRFRCEIWFAGHITWRDAFANTQAPGSRALEQPKFLSGAFILIARQAQQKKRRGEGEPRNAAKERVSRNTCSCTMIVKKDASPSVIPSRLCFAWSNVNGPWKLDTFCFYASMNHLARCVSGFVSRIGVVGDWFFAIEASRIRVRSCRIRSWPSIYSNN